MSIVVVMSSNTPDSGCPGASVPGFVLPWGRGW